MTTKAEEIAKLKAAIAAQTAKESGPEEDDDKESTADGNVNPFASTDPQDRK